MSNSQKSLQQLADYSSDAIAPNSMDIRTEYLEPITSSPLKYTFRLDQAGYLDTNSLIVFKLAATSTPVSNNLRVNAFNGVLGGVKRAIFQVGDHIINDIQDLNKYATLKQVLAGNRSVSNQYTGHYIGSQLWTKVVSSGEATTEASTAARNSTYQLLDNAVAGSIVVDRDKSGMNYGEFVAGTNFNINSQPIGEDVSTNNQYGITLGTLFPALQGQKIPLFLFDKQRILITIEFHGASKYVNKLVGTTTNYTAGGANNGIALDADVAIQQVRMVVDYIIMPSEVQNKIIEQTQKQGGYKLNFFDVVSVEKNIPANAVNNTIQEVEHRIGQNNREVHNVYMWKEQPSVSLNNSDNTFANQSGQALRCGSGQSCMGNSEEEFNVEVNGRDEFDAFVYNPCSQYNELSECLGADPNLDRPEYIGDEMTAGSMLTTAESGLMGSMKPLAVCLRSGEPGVIGAGRQIGSYPIVWKYKRRTHTAANGNSLINNQTMKVNYLIECSRTASIMSTPKGMNVMVSY